MEKISFISDYVCPIALPCGNDDYAGEPGIASGWGQTADSKFNKIVLTLS